MMCPQLARSPVPAVVLGAAVPMAEREEREAQEGRVGQEAVADWAVGE